MAIINYNDDIIDDYSIITKNMNDIVDEAFKSDEERLLAKSIIDNLEHDAVEGIKSGQTIKIPSIGNYRYNPIKKHIRDHYKDFKEAKKSMSKEEYREYVGGTVDYWKEQIRLDDMDKVKNRKLKWRYRKKYNTLCKKHGFLFANLWFHFLYNVKMVEYDAELEYHLRSLYDGE